MRVSFSYSLKRFFSPEAFLPFLIGAICLAINDVHNPLEFADRVN